MSDLDEVIWSTKQHLSSPQYVQILTETAKEYGGYKNAHDSSVYYMLGAFILLVIYIVPFNKSKKKVEDKDTETDLSISE